MTVLLSMPMRYNTPDAAVQSLAQWIEDVHNSGLHIRGLNVETVEVQRLEDAPPPKPRPKPTPPAYTGNECQACGSPNMRPSGACETCQDCGETSGCG